MTLDTTKPMEAIDKAIKEKFHTKVDQEYNMWKFQGLLLDREQIVDELESVKRSLERKDIQIESFFDMIGLNKLSKQEWREKYLLTETSVNSKEK